MGFAADVIIMLTGIAYILTPESTKPKTKPKTDREEWNEFLDGVQEGLWHVEQRKEQ